MTTEKYIKYYREHPEAFCEKCMGIYIGIKKYTLRHCLNARKYFGSNRFVDIKMVFSFKE